jgi:predicted GIY-YIG superfamily endonuclease
MGHVVYLLADRASNRRYRGYTVNLQRRLRQHRREIKGGAKATRNFGDAQVLVHITGFPTSHLGLSFEWHAMRRFRLKIYRTMLRIKGDIRLSKYLAPLALPKFRDLPLVVHLSPAVAHHASSIAKFYQVRTAAAEDLPAQQPPECATAVPK